MYLGLVLLIFGKRGCWVLTEARWVGGLFDGGSGIFFDVLLLGIYYRLMRLVLLVFLVSASRLEERFVDCVVILTIFLEEVGLFLPAERLYINLKKWEYIDYLLQ